MRRLLGSRGQRCLEFSYPELRPRISTSTSRCSSARSRVANAPTSERPKPRMQFVDPVDPHTMTVKGTLIELVIKLFGLRQMQWVHSLLVRWCRLWLRSSVSAISQY